MATYNKIAYMVYDELKLSSDDSFFVPEHVFFLMDNYRSILLKQRYADVKKDIPLANYQTICLDFTYNDGQCMYPESVKSVQEVPYFTNLNGMESIQVNAMGDLFTNYDYALVTDNRFTYVGNNKWLKKIVYFTLGSDRHLYAKSSNPDFKYIKKMQVSAVFDSPQQAQQYSCNPDACPSMDDEYPLEASLIPPLIQMIVQELRQPTTIIKEDKSNDADDDMANLNRPSYMPNYGMGGYGMMPGMMPQQQSLATPKQKR